MIYSKPNYYKSLLGSLFSRHINVYSAPGTGVGRYGRSRECVVEFHGEIRR